MPVDMTALAADLAAESAVTRALVAGLDEAGWHTPTPAAGWDIADQISHLAYFDEVTVQSALRPRAVQGRTRRGRSQRRHQPRHDRRPVPRPQRGAAAQLVRHGPRRPFEHVQKSGPPSPAAVVRPGHERRVVADRPDHGDLGAHPGHRRRPRCHPRAHDRLRHVAHIGVGARAFSYAVRGRTSRSPGPGRAHRPGRRRMDLGSAGRRGPGNRPGPGLLPAGDPAQAPRRPGPGHRGPGRDRVDVDRPGLRGRGGHRAAATEASDA